MRLQIGDKNTVKDKSALIEDTIWSVLARENRDIGCYLSKFWASGAKAVTKVVKQRFRVRLKIQFCLKT